MSKLLVSPLITLRVVPYVIPYIIPLSLDYGSLKGLGLAGSRVCRA